jgi:hypothetical protein
MGTKFKNRLKRRRRKKQALPLWEDTGPRMGLSTKCRVSHPVEYLQNKNKINNGRIESERTIGI